MKKIRHAAIAALSTFLCASAADTAHAQDKDALYKAETIVTGTREPERLQGFGVGAKEVLIKLTGQPGLAGAKPAKDVIARAPKLIADYSYEDRMKDIPVHDEQGTRDRPYFLRMRFDPEKFDKALKDAGLAKWVGKRPTVAVWLGIREGRGKYILSRDGEGGYGQREVLKEASARLGIPIVLPTDDQHDVTYENIVKRNWGALLTASQKLGADSVLYGTLEFDGNAYWNSQWVVAGDHAYAKWKLNGVTFDKALKEAIDRVATVHARQATSFRDEKK